MIYYKAVERLDVLLKHLFHKIIFWDRVHLLVITNLPTKFNDRRSMRSIVIDL